MSSEKLLSNAPHEAGCDHVGCVPTSASDSLRCPCGSLLARYTDAGIELKCRRCKRTIVLPVAAAPSEGSTSF